MFEASDVPVRPLPAIEIDCHDGDEVVPFDISTWPDVPPFPLLDVFRFQAPLFSMYRRVEFPVTRKIPAEAFVPRTRAPAFEPNPDELLVYPMNASLADASEAVR
jgi:hypothetical protein